MWSKWETPILKLSKTTTSAPPAHHTVLYRNNVLCFPWAKCCLGNEAAYLPRLNLTSEVQHWQDGGAEVVVLDSFKMGVSWLDHICPNLFN